MTNFLKYLFTISIILISYNLNAKDNYIKVNYGSASHDLEVSASKNTVGTMTAIKTEDTDDGFLLSAGRMIGDNWGVDLMYYDFGELSVTVDARDYIKLNNNTYEVLTSGKIKNETKGYGLGFIGAVDAGSEGFGGLSYYVKAGIHAWDRSGTKTTLLDNNVAFNADFNNQGIGAYAGIGFSINLMSNVALDIAYDAMGMSNNASLDNNTSLISGGLKVIF